MMIRCLLLSSFTVAVIGCAARVSDPVTSTDHPANSNAAEARVAPPHIFAALSAPETGTNVSMPTTPQAAHDMGAMQGGMQASPMAQPATTQAGNLYACPMHSDVVSANPNDLCPKCNMKINKLVQRVPAPSNASGSSAGGTAAPGAATGGGHDGH